MYKLLLLLIVLFMPGVVWAELSVSMLELALGKPLIVEQRRSLEVAVTDYLQFEGNKALALGYDSSGDVIVGVAQNRASELSASRAALEKCQKHLLAEGAGDCEIVVLGDQVIQTGHRLLRDVKGNEPAMAWKVSGKKADLYLLGTLHVLKPSLLPLPPVFDEFFSASRVVAFEINPLLQTNPERQRRVATLMGGLSGAGADLYDDHEAAVIQSYVSSQDLVTSSFYSAKPVISALQVTQLKTAAIGYSVSSGVEMQFARRAAQLSKPIVELETPEQAFAALIDLPLPLQKQLLLETIKELDSVPIEIEAVVTAWLRGDADAVYQMTRQDLELAPEFSDLIYGMLDRRNQQWMVKITELLAGEEDVVVMVGSAHFGGENGLLALLSRSGYAPHQFSWSGAPLNK